VLAAATSGELTKEWREENGLDRGDPKGAYPESWQQLMIDDIAEVKGGKRLPKGEALVEQDTGYLYIRAGQLKNGTVIDGNDTRNRQMFISNEVHQQIKRYTVEGGDAYITIVGASIGDAGVIPDRVSGANLTENAAKLTNFKVPLSVDFLSCWLRSETLQALIKLEIKSGAQGKLALKRIKTLPFPYPSLNEQRAIVKKFEELTIMSENVEKQYQAAKNRLDKLTQSILAKAFKGELLSNSVDSNIEAIENSIEALNA
jgi:type I restriction enzyme S subunit